MPVILEMFLSWRVIPILLGMYLLSTLIVMIGFRKLEIKRRADVKFRAILMLGTFIFMCQSIGVMVISIGYLFFTINQVVMNGVIRIVAVIFAMLICDIIYVFISNYLWDRLAIDNETSVKLSLVSLIVVTPWYFFINIF